MASVVHRISIITVHLNHWEGLRLTYDSLVPFLADDFLEWIVVDGGSRFDTPREMEIREAVCRASHSFISEPDEGIYFAMNKGTSLATGSYVLYLNSGDEMHPRVDWPLIQKSMDQSPGMIWCDSYDKDRKHALYKRKTRSPAWLNYGMAVCHQAVFFRKSLLVDGPYDVSYELAADYDLTCRLYVAGDSIARLEVPVAIFDLVGESGKDKRRTLREESIIRTRHFKRSNMLDTIMMNFKWTLWEISSKIPELRRIWRRWI